MERDQIRRLIGLAPSRPSIAEAKDEYLKVTAEKAKTAVQQAKKLRKCAEEVQEFWNVQREAEAKLIDKLTGMQRAADELEDQYLADLVDAFCNAQEEVFRSSLKLKDQGAMLAEALFATAATLEGHNEK